ncbi:MAG: hypothetical protein AAF570_06930 [Bacteroidota bacterium]
MTQNTPSSKTNSNGHAPKVNPWTGIWTRTGAALEFVIRYRLEDWIHRLFMGTAIMLLLAIRLPGWLAETPHPIGVMIQVLLVAPIFGIGLGYIYSAVVRNIGYRFKVEVDSRIMRATVAWTHLPFLVAWLVFLLSYGILSGLQGPEMAGKIWLFQGAMGWIPVIAGGLIFLWGVYIRWRAYAFLFRISMAKAAAIWGISFLISFAPTIALSTTYYVIFRTTVGNAMGAG